MKYFTPDLWLLMQSGSPRTTFLATSEAWERAVSDYEATLASLLPTDTPQRSFREFASQESLHDGVVEACWLEDSDRLTLLVRPDGPSERLVLLQYTIESLPEVRHGVLPPVFTSSEARWMYDEFERIDAPANDTEPIFSHNILLGNGCELVIRFRHLVVSHPDPVRLGHDVPTKAPWKPRRRSASEV